MSTLEQKLSEIKEQLPELEWTITGTDDALVVAITQNGEEYATIGEGTAGDIAACLDAHFTAKPPEMVVVNEVETIVVPPVDGKKSTKKAIDTLDKPDAE